LLNLPQSQINLTLTGGLDTPPGEDRHIFKIYKTDLPSELQNANRLVFYWQLHESRTFVWANSLQENYDAPPTNDWGGYLYNTDGWPAESTLGSGYVPGSSGHIHLEFISGSRDVPIPIPERLPGAVDGLKFLDVNGDSLYDGGDNTLSGWRIYVSGMVENILFETSTLTDEFGNYSFPNLTAGTWILSEDDQREVPAETGYMQTYTNLYSPDVGVGSAYAIAEPGRGPWGWEVHLSIDTTDQGDLNFGNKLCELVCTDPPDVTIECTDSTDPDFNGWPIIDYNCGPVDTSYSDDVSGSCPTVITRTWTFTDYVGNTCISDQIITVVDTIAPVITCPSDVAFDCVMGDPGVATATDNCDPDPVITYDDVVTNARCPKIIERTWTATDSCGNFSTCLQTITIQDTTAPAISCPSDVVFDCAMGDAGTATATDNCDPSPTIIMVYTDIPDGPGTYARGWIAVDVCGNASDTCYQTITVEPCPCTFTIGGWGTSCPGDVSNYHPGCIRDNYWGVVFGTDSVMIGHPDGFTAKWSSSQAVADFLPNGSTAGVLDQNYVDPLSTSAGVLASQILALRLNVEYSCAGIFTILGFPTAGDCYGDALVPESCANGLFSGLTIYEFLALADSTVAGLNTGFTPSEVNYTATCLNEYESDCDPYAPTGASFEGDVIKSAKPTVGQIPTEFSLAQNYPNPFNARTEFQFGIPTGSHVTLDIFNIMGQKVTRLVDGYHEPGMYNVEWDGNSVSSGVLFYRIEAGEYIEMRKMLLLK
jgi:hypothetical protein